MMQAHRRQGHDFLRVLVGAARIELATTCSRRRYPCTGQPRMAVDPRKLPKYLGAIRQLSKANRAKVKAIRAVQRTRSSPSASGVATCLRRGRLRRRGDPLLFRGLPLDGFRRRCWGAAIRGVRFRALDCCRAYRLRCRGRGRGCRESSRAEPEGEHESLERQEPFVLHGHRIRPPALLAGRALGHTSASTAEQYSRPDEHSLQSIGDALDSATNESQSDAGHVGRPGEP